VDRVIHRRIPYTPERKAAHSALFLRHFSDPANRQKIIDGMRRGKKTRTKFTPERLAAHSAMLRRYYSDPNNRRKMSESCKKGKSGKALSKTGRTRLKRKMSQTMSAYWSDPANKERQRQKKIKLWKTKAYREKTIPKLLDFEHRYARKYNGPGGSVVFKSSYELAYANYLDRLHVKWVYEPRTFYFSKRSKFTSYTPDFYLPKLKKFVEIKGWIRAKWKDKIRAFKRQFPEIVLEILTMAKLKRVCLPEMRAAGAETKVRAQHLMTKKKRVA
jgi:hypothetical protein